MSAVVFDASSFLDHSDLYITHCRCEHCCLLWDVQTLFTCCSQISFFRSFTSVFHTENKLSDSLCDIFDIVVVVVCNWKWIRGHFFSLLLQEVQLQDELKPLAWILCTYLYTFTFKVSVWLTCYSLFDFRVIFFFSFHFPSLNCSEPSIEWICKCLLLLIQYMLLETPILLFKVLLMSFFSIMAQSFILFYFLRVAI